MKNARKMTIGLLFLVSTMSFANVPAMAGTYSSLNGVAGLDVAYDFRLSDPKAAALFLKLIHETYLDHDLRDMTESPRFVVVVNGAAVRLIAGNQPGHSAEDRQYIEEIADRIKQMAADGIYFEGCLKAAEIFKVDADLFLSDINKINNAWISLAGYQAQQFSTLPIV